MGTFSYSDLQVKFLKELVAKHGKNWSIVSEEYNNKFGDNKTPNAVRKTFNRFEDEEISDDTVISTLEKARKATVDNNKLRKTQQILLDKQITVESAVDILSAAIKAGNYKPIFVPKYTVDKTKKEMAMEVLFSDVHAGKKSDQFNLKILEARIKELSHTMLKEMTRYDTIYNVSTVIFAMLGDMIENSYFHQMESMSACEVENSEQVRIITELVYKYFLVPLARTGKKIIIPCITGNHSRWLPHKTYNKPGKNNISWIIYNFLRLLCETNGLKNLTFIIPEGLYCAVELFGKVIVYEHGDEIKGRSENDIEKHIHNRSKQLHKMIDFFRMGDKHQFAVYNKGRIIINGALCGNDSYSDSKGYSGIATQGINFYINRKKGCPFYHSFPVDLESVEE